MAKFIYNNDKNANISHLSFEINYRFYFRIFYKDDINPQWKSKVVEKLTIKLKQLTAVNKKYLQHI